MIKEKKKKTGLHRIAALCVMLAVCTVAVSDMPTVFGKVDKKKASESSLKEAQQEKKALERELEKAKQTVQELKNTKGDVQQKVAQLNSQLVGISQRITSLEKQLEQKNIELADKNEEIKRTEGQLVDAQAQERQQYEDMKVRMQFIYENAQSSYLELMFASKDISEFLNSAEYISQLQDYDRRKLKEYQGIVEQIKHVKAQLEEEYVTLEELKASVEQEKADVEQQKASVASLMQQRETELANLEGDISSAQNEAAYYAAEIQAQNELIAEIKRIEAERAAAGRQNNPYTGGAFVWPCPASTRITSNYGARVSPTGGASSNHKGIDIGAPGGAPIVAAAGGTVTTASYSSAAGNYVMISHGGGLYTVYMHASALLVSPGQTVSAGQTIAKVGSTGISTGNHLHFGVSLNGSYVSPWNYLGG